MKTKLLSMGILALALVFGIISCGGGDDDKPSNKLPAAKKYVTVTGLGDYNGKYVMASGSYYVGEEDFAIVGISKVSGTSEADAQLTLVKIEGGKAKIPLYTSLEDTSSFEAYDRNDDNVALTFMIYAEEVVKSADISPPAEGVPPAVMPVAMKQATANFDGNDNPEVAAQNVAG